MMNIEYIWNYILKKTQKITLQLLKQKLKNEHNIDVSKECIRQHLDGLLYTLKDVQREPEKAKSDVNKMKRSEYVKYLLEYQADNIPIIYMDDLL